MPEIRPPAQPAVWSPRDRGWVARCPFCGFAHHLGRAFEPKPGHCHPRAFAVRPVSAPWLAQVLDDEVAIVGARRRLRRRRGSRMLRGLRRDDSAPPGYVLLVDGADAPLGGDAAGATILADGAVARTVREVAVVREGAAAWIYAPLTAPWLDAGFARVYLERLRVIVEAAAL